LWELAAAAVETADQAAAVANFVKDLSLSHQVRR
jgi:hypothetical protein